MQLALRAAFPRERLFPYYRADWLEQLEVDFFMPKYSIAIEVHGRQHFEAVACFGGEPGFHAQQSRDRKKSRLCRREGVNLIVVDCRRYAHEVIADALVRVGAYIGREPRPVDVSGILIDVLHRASPSRRPRSAEYAFPLIAVNGRPRVESVTSKARRIQRTLDTLSCDLSVTAGNVHLVWWMDDLRVSVPFVEEHLLTDHGVKLLNLKSSDPERHGNLRGYTIPYAYRRRNYALRQGQAVTFLWKGAECPSTFLGLDDENMMLICMKEYGYRSPFKVERTDQTVIPIDSTVR